MRSSEHRDSEPANRPLSHRWTSDHDAADHPRPKIEPPFPQPPARPPRRNAATPPPQPLSRSCRRNPSPAHPRRAAQPAAGQTPTPPKPTPTQADTRPHGPRPRRPADAAPARPAPSRSRSKAPPRQRSTAVQAGPRRAGVHRPSLLNIHKAAQQAPAGVPPCPWPRRRDRRGKPGAPADGRPRQRRRAGGTSRLNGLSPYPYGAMPSGGPACAAPWSAAPTPRRCALSGAERAHCNERFGDIAHAPALDGIPGAKRAAFDKAADHEAAGRKYRAHADLRRAPSEPGGIAHGPASSRGPRSPRQRLPAEMTSPVATMLTITAALAAPAGLARAQDSIRPGYWEIARPGVSPLPSEQVRPAVHHAQGRRQIHELPHQPPSMPAPVPEETIGGGKIAFKGQCVDHKGQHVGIEGTGVFTATTLQHDRRRANFRLLGLPVDRRRLHRRPSPGRHLPPRLAGGPPAGDSRRRSVNR